MTTKYDSVCLVYVSVNVSQQPFKEEFINYLLMIFHSYLLVVGSTRLVAGYFVPVPVVLFSTLILRLNSRKESFSKIQK
jgi:hypothetical protein